MDVTTYLEVRRQVRTQSESLCCQGLSFKNTLLLYFLKILASMHSTWDLSSHQGLNPQAHNSCSRSTES